MKMHAGRLDRRASFWSPALISGQGGEQQSGWMQEMTVWANVRWLRGAEVVIAARLAGRQPAVITIRKSDVASEITTDWKMVLAGADYAIRAIVPTEDRRWIEVTVEGGVQV